MTRRTRRGRPRNNDRNSRRSFRMTQTYWDRFDRLSHIYGSQAEAFRLAIEALEREQEQEHGEHR